MRSPTYTLLWEIWRRHRLTATAIIVLTVAGRLLEFSEQASAPGRAASGPSPVIELLAMVALVLLFGMFNYTEPSGKRGIGRFPHRLFTLPISSMRLVAVPVLAGVASVELFYVLWRAPLARGGSTSAAFVAVLLGALMVFYQAVLWILEPLGELRLVTIGTVAFVVYWVGMLPSFPPTPPPRWRSETALGTIVAGLAVVVFLLTWRYVVRLRQGGQSRARRIERLIAMVSAALPRTPKTAFASPAGAQFWFEWRSSGVVLPFLVGGILLVIVGPFAWMTRNDAGGTFRLLLGILLMPIILAVPVGMAFAKPTFWSEDVSVPTFIAVLPLSEEDLVAVKVKVAAVSVLISWLLVLSFLAVWLPLAANLDSVSRFAIQLWVVHQNSVAAVYGTAALVATACIFLTWRFLVSRLATGLLGKRPIFIASVLFVFVLGIAAAAFDATRLPGWILEDPARMAMIVWLLAVAVIVKYWLAVYSWRGISAPYVRQYLLVWSAGTTCLLILAMLFWGVVRIYVALDIYEFQGLMILLALLAVPLGRVGLASSCLAHNRHR